MVYPCYKYNKYESDFFSKIGINIGNRFLNIDFDSNLFISLFSKG